MEVGGGAEGGVYDLNLFLFRVFGVGDFWVILKTLLLLFYVCLMFVCLFICLQPVTAALYSDQSGAAFGRLTGRPSMRERPL